MSFAKLGVYVYAWEELKGASRSKAKQLSLDMAADFAPRKEIMLFSAMKNPVWAAQSNVNAGHKAASKPGDWCILWGKVIMDKFGVLYWILIGKDEKHWKKVMTL